MILTITLNPSIDRRYNVENFEKGNIYKTSNYQYTAGGKGLNVTRVIKSFNEDVLATGFLGGYSGRFIEENLNGIGINHVFIPIEGENRSCIAIISDDGSQTEILEKGPYISKKNFNNFLALYDRLLDGVDIICASGSLPDGIPIDTYKQLIKLAKDKGKRFILDSSGDALRYGVEASPYLIKPNKYELEKLTGISIADEKSIIKASNYLLDKNIEIVVISLGGQGSIVFYKGNMYRVRVPPIELVNSVGSGDSMIAGLAVGLNRNLSFEDMLKLGTACGTSNAMEHETGKVNHDNLSDIIGEIVIEKLSGSILRN